MSRSGYVDDSDNEWAMIRWRGAVTSAIRGKRGQALLKEMAASLDALPEKELIAGELVEEDSVCALGAVGLTRGVDLSKLDPEEYVSIASAFDISEALVREIEYENDEGGYNETPSKRWERMRKWVSKHIKPEAATGDQS